MFGVTAVIVTRGDVDLGPCLSSIDVETIIIASGNGGVWERYRAAIERVSSGLVYTQDDDCVVDAAAVIAQHQPGKVTSNMPQWKRHEYPDEIALVGWGAVFEPHLAVEAFARYRAFFPQDDLFRRECDRVFTGLSPLKLIDVPFSHLPHAHGKERLGAQPEHLQRLAEIRKRIYRVRAAA